MGDPSFSIAGRQVGRDHPPYVIAEAGVHHYNSVELAKAYILHAKLAGADAIKFQTYSADRLVTRWATTYWDASGPTTQYEIFAQRSRLNEQDYADLFAYAADVGIQLMSTPFDPEAAQMLAGLGMAAFKIASGDLTHAPLLETVAGLDTPIILSTGASTMDEIRAAVKTLSHSGAADVALLHCSLAYPSRMTDANLMRIDALRQAFPERVIGYSDHTMPSESELACPLAAGHGAVIIEKHFTLNSALPEDDHYHSVDQAGLSRLVKNCVDAWSATRSALEMTAVEAAARQGARRSIVAARDIGKGAIIQAEDLDYKRPGTGLPPTARSLVLGKRATRAFKPDDLLDEEGLANA